MIYRVAPGWNVDFEDLFALRPQPRTKGLKYDNRQFTGANTVVDDLPYVEFEWPVISIQNYWAVLPHFDLMLNTESEVTVTCQDQRHQDAMKNGIAILPQLGEDGERDFVWLKNIIITVHSLRDLE